ncbi:hypothetical protein FHG87_003071 [Trinorchestia longiramus]|nr:hypothetical protein FHG87_003071 [Trinorchestia longiramus]
MVTLQVHLFALMVLGTIWSCEEVVGQQSDTYPVVIGDGVSSLFGCAKSNVKTANVSFNKLKARGPDSDVVYHRTTVTKERLQNSNEIVDLPSTNIGACAQAAATKGLDAFVFDGSCTGYQLGAPSCKCATDGLAIFVLPGKFAKEGTPLILDEFPYEMIEVKGKFPARQYMLTSFIEPGEYNEFYPALGEGPQGPLNLILAFKSSITREDGEIFVPSHLAVDLLSCLADSGLPIRIASMLYEYKNTVAYFFNECGNAIQLPSKSQARGLYLYSHEGLGCIDNPNEIPDECTVTLESCEDIMDFVICEFSDPKLDDGCHGFNATLTGSSLQSDETITSSSCNPSSDGLYLRGYTTYTLSVQKHKATPKSVFSCVFTRSE